MCENCEKRSHVGCIWLYLVDHPRNFQLLKVTQSPRVQVTASQVECAGLSARPSKAVLVLGEGPQDSVGYGAGEKIEAPENH